MEKVLHHWTSVSVSYMSSRKPFKTIDGTLVSFTSELFLGRGKILLLHCKNGRNPFCNSHVIYPTH